MASEPMLNIGCGATRHPDWINLDVAAAGPDVMQFDVARGLPFGSGEASVCYSSHVLEHLDRAAARTLVAECFRVLKPGGVIRLAVPDLERLARDYLQALDAAEGGDAARGSEYEWLMLELYDQAVRNRPGGEMASFLERLPEKERAFVRARIGAEADKFWTPARPRRGMGRIRASTALKAAREAVAGWLVYLVAGRAAYCSYRGGLFRARGEVHQWMYDRHSLRLLLEQAGFTRVAVCAADESRIPEFARYGLDVVAGAIRKPDSLFMEASKA
jgi:SAM-dependent methyltransferase